MRKTGTGKKRPRILRYLLYLVLVTEVFACLTLARFVSQEQGGANAMVAAFVNGGTLSFEETLDEELYPGMPDMLIPFTVQNFQDERDCEVALEYEIQVTTTGNLPLTFSLDYQKEPTDNSAASVCAAPLNKLDDVTWKATGGKLPVPSLDARRVHSFSLRVAWPDTQSSDMNAKYSGEIDMVQISVKATQVDPGAAA